MCNNCFPNNDGGFWCWKHPIEVTRRDCMKCKGIILIEDYRQEKEPQKPSWREFMWKEG